MEICTIGNFMWEQNISPNRFCNKFMLLGFKVTSEWTVLHTLLHYWQQTFFVVTFSVFQFLLSSILLLGFFFTFFYPWLLNNKELCYEYIKAFICLTDLKHIHLSSVSVNTPPTFPSSEWWAANPCSAGGWAPPHSFYMSDGNQSPASVPTTSSYFSLCQACPLLPSNTGLPGPFLNPYPSYPQPASLPCSAKEAITAIIAG